MALDSTKMIDSTLMNPGTSGSIGSQWNTVLSEYEQSQDWFRDLIYVHLDKFVPSLTSLDLTTKQVNPVFGTAGKLQSAYAGLFRPFSEFDWDSLDDVTNLTQGQAREDLELLKKQKKSTIALETEILSDEKDKKIAQAEFELEKDLNAIDSDKQQMKNQAIKSLSQIDNLVANTGIVSGSYEKKREIANDSIQQSLNQANYNRLLAVQKLEKEKKYAKEDYKSSIAETNLKFDTQYETKMQDLESKTETMNLNAMIDKIDMYESWKADQINNLSQITIADYYINKPELVDTTNPQVVGDDYNTVFQDCISSGRTAAECNEFAADIYDYTSVIPDITYDDPNRQGNFITNLVDTFCNKNPWFPGC